jgi:hypothetical protein
MVDCHSIHSAYCGAHPYTHTCNMGSISIVTNRLSIVERKVLGALMMMANDQGIVQTKLGDIAHLIGYKQGGGIITYAIKFLEMSNYIVINQKGTTTKKAEYKVLV